VETEGRHKPRITLAVKLTLFAAVLVLLVGGAMAYFLVFRSAAERTEAMLSRVDAFTKIIGGMKASGIQGRQYDPFLVKTLVDYGQGLGTDLCFVVFEEPGKSAEGVANASCLQAAAPLLSQDVPDPGSAEGLSRLARLNNRRENLWVQSLQVKPSRDAPAILRATLGFSGINLERQLRDSLLANILVTGAAILAGLIMAVLLARQFARPIREVARAMRLVAEGDLSQNLALNRSDEVGVLASAFNVMTRGLRERERIKSTFARYVSDTVAERILKEEKDLDLRGELRQVTILFLDIRGFTALVELLPPQEVVALLNDYFEIIIDIIFRYEGTINKFIGDSILAIYGAPQEVDLPELRAVATAAEIQRAVGEFNWRRMQAGKPVANFGIGIHAGEAIAGNIGSARRMEYTVIGRSVNLAQRIQASSREGQILISESVRDKAKDRIATQVLEPVFLKGILEPIELFEVTAVNWERLPAAWAGPQATAGRYA
jgi:class 3 adenylate cyclase